MKDSLSRMNFLCISTDNSNRKHRKLLPVLVRGFDDAEGVKMFKLNVKELSNETSETITSELVAPCNYNSNSI